MNKQKYLVLFLLIGFLLNSCGVTYKKENLTQDLENLVKKETGQKSKAHVVGRTLYLDMQVEFAAPPIDINLFFANVLTSKLCTLRAVLSSDSDIRFMVVTAYYNPIYIRNVSSLDDFKSLFYMRISKSDYESRNIIETSQYLLAKIFQDKHDISIREFAGRLIVSRLNSSQTVGIAAQYVDVKDKTLFLVLLQGYNEAKKQLFEDFLREQLRNYSKKYDNSLDSIEVLDLQGNKMMSVS